MPDEILKLRPSLSPDEEERLEREAVALLDALQAANVPGDWRPSPVEEAARPVREALVRTPGVLRRFRRTFLAAGRQNFPDSPRPKEFFLQWGEKLPSRLQRWRGAVLLLRMAWALRRRAPFRLANLDDPGAGSPSTYAVPFSSAGRRITEAQMRAFYYRHQICAACGGETGPVLEIGGGFGGVAAELLRHVRIPTYYLAELPDALPLAYFYLRSCFDCPVQVLFRPEDRPDPGCRIVLLAPWKLADLEPGIDLAINTMSFQHMDLPNLQFYFSHIGRLGTRRMYLVNRNRKRDPSDVIIDDYPIPAGMALAGDTEWFFGDHRERWYEAPGR